MTTVFAAESGGGSFLVSPNVGLMIWTLVVFGISLLILWKVAFPRISEALDKRQRAIEDSIDSAERTRREADQLLAEYRERPGRRTGGGAGPGGPRRAPAAGPRRPPPAPAAPARRRRTRSWRGRAQSARR